MKNPAISLVLAAGMLSLAGAGARADTADDVAASAPAQRVEVAAPRAADAAIDTALRDIDQRYQMSDGRPMSVVASGGGAVRVRYGRRHERELLREGSGRYASRDGALALRFEIDDRGEATIAHLTMPASWQ